MGGSREDARELGGDREKCSHWWRCRVTWDRRLAGYWLVTLAGRVTGVGDTNGDTARLRHQREDTSRRCWKQKELPEKHSICGHMIGLFRCCEAKDFVNLQPGLQLMFGGNVVQRVQEAIN